MATESVQIRLDTSEGEKLFEVTPLPATKNYLLLVKLAKVIGPALAEGLRSIDPKKGFGLQDVSSLAPAIARLFLELSEEDALRVLLDLTAGGVCFMGDKPLPLNRQAIDMLFKRKLVSMIKLMAFAIEVNFGDFTDALSALQSVMGAPTQPTKSESNISQLPGQSIAS